VKHLPGVGNNEPKTKLSSLAVLLKYLEQRFLGFIQADFTLILCQGVVTAALDSGYL